MQLRLYSTNSSAPRCPQRTHSHVPIWKHGATMTKNVLRWVILGGNVKKYYYSIKDVSRCSRIVALRRT